MRQTSNVIHGNGLAGMTIHAHEPFQNLNGNEIVGNNIGRNNLLGDPIGLAPAGEGSSGHAAHRHPGRQFLPAACADPGHASAVG